MGTPKTVQKRRKKKKKANIFVRIIICLICLAGTGFFAYQIFNEGMRTYTLTVDINDSKEQIENLKKENASLVDQKEKLQDVNYVKNLARGEFLLSKDGEQIFHLPKIEENE
jgi:Septum formation initiator